MFDALLEEGYTIGYSHAHGANYGNDKALQAIIDLHAYMVKATGIHPTAHLFAFSMGGLLALQLMNKVDFIQSVAFSQPLLNVNKQREYIEKNYLDADDPLGHAIAAAHDMEYSAVNTYIDETFDLGKLALAATPCEIWHRTGDRNVPVELNTMPFTAIRISHHKSIIQFFHQNE